MTFSGNCWVQVSMPGGRVLHSAQMQQGQTLTAWPGMWTTGAAYGYQWQEDDGGWTNITGAAGPTFVPGAGQVGNALRVIVTATNAAGSASATSAPTVVTAGV